VSSAGMSGTTLINQSSVATDALRIFQSVLADLPQLTGKLLRVRFPDRCCAHKWRKETVRGAGGVSERVGACQCYMCYIQEKAKKEEAAVGNRTGLHKRVLALFAPIIKIRTINLAIYNLESLRVLP
jgi:hypothetical protein